MKHHDACRDRSRRDCTCRRRWAVARQWAPALPQTGPAERRIAMRILSSLATRGAVVALVGTACAGSSSYVYTPDSANATEAGLPASRTPIPQERPEGAIEVTSYGITDLSQDS